MQTTEQAFAIARPKARKLARQGRLVDESFKLFRKLVWPDASPEQVAELRVAFFAGAQELLTMQAAALDPEEEASEGDFTFMNDVAEELQRFHEKTLRKAFGVPEQRN